MASNAPTDDFGFIPDVPAADDFGFIPDPPSAPVAPPPKSPLAQVAPMTASVVEDEFRQRPANPTMVPTVPFYDRAGGQPLANPGKDPMAAEQAKSFVADLARYGPPAVAATIAAPATLAGAAIAGGAAALSEAGAQGIEMLSGQRESFQPGKVAGAGVLGATPIGAARGVSGPLSAALKGALRQAAINEVSFAVSKVTETALDEGRLPTSAEVAAAVSEPLNYLPAALGAGIGGAQGFLSRPAQQLTTEQRIAQEGAAARTRLEAATGQPAPLTGTQQTGRNIPGEFKNASGEIAAQQAVPEAVATKLGVSPDPAVSLAAEQELVQAADKAGRGLAGSVERTSGEAASAIESQLSTSLPGSARAGSVQEAANTTVNSVRGTAQKLKDDVDKAFTDARSKAAAAAAGKPPEALMERPRTAGKEAEKVLDSLAVKEVVEADGSVTRIPSQFFDEATKMARGIMEVADSPQTLEQITGLRQAVGELMDQGTQIAPGFGKKQLSGLYKALEVDEANAAAKYGPDVANAFKSARAVAKNRFDTLESNPVILKILKDPSERGALQNSEDLYRTLAAQPEALGSLKKMLGPTEYQQVRRGLFDSLRHPDPVVINGTPFENSGSLSKNFRNIPQAVREEIAGDAAKATALQSILDDANRVQNAGRAIPVSGGISNATLNEIQNTAGKISNTALRKAVLADAAQAAKNSQQYYNTTTAAVRARTLNPDIEPDKFVRDFVLNSSNAQVVDDALNQLTPTTRSAVRKQAAKVFLDAAVDASATAKGIEGLVGDKNRLEIARKILAPADYDLVNDFMAWSRARNLTASGGKLEPNQLATFVWRVTKARFVIDAVLGSLKMQDFLSSASKAPTWLGNLLKSGQSASGITQQQIDSAASSAGITSQLLVKQWADYAKQSDAARDSLPKDKQAAFQDSLGVPPPPK